MNQFEYEPYRAAAAGTRQLRRHTQLCAGLPLLLLVFAQPASAALRVRSSPSGTKLCGGKPCPYGDHSQGPVYATGETVQADTGSGVIWERAGTGSSSESVQAATPYTQGGFMDQFDDALKEPLATPCPVGSINTTTNITDAVNANISNANISSAGSNGTATGIVIPAGTWNHSANVIPSSGGSVSPVITWHDEDPTVRTVQYKAPAQREATISADHAWIQYLDDRAKLKSLKVVGADEWRADKWVPGWVDEGRLPSEMWINGKTEEIWQNLAYLKQVNDQSYYKNVTSYRSPLYEGEKMPYPPLYQGFDSPYVQTSGTARYGLPEIQKSEIKLERSE